jgi:NADH-quinone oxidoreductase subunit F
MSAGPLLTPAPRALSRWPTMTSTRPRPPLPDAPQWLIQEPFATHAEYLRRRGGSAVEAARARTPEEVVDEISRAGLRGRGGAGFPAGAKWRTTMRSEAATRYAVCNAAEGEPGTFKDRYLLRRDPYSMLEGLLIAAHVAGAEVAYVAMKASFTPELARVRAAIAEMQAAGALGGVEVRVVEGPEEYLFGEERALLEVIEGNDPLPREPHYPPYERGLFATQAQPNPAIVNNVETLARAAEIVRHGAASFRAIGTADTPGPLLFTLSGDVQRPGVYERAAGVTLRELIFEAAGGPRPGRQVKAVLAGVSAAVLGADRLDTMADHAHLTLAGSALGSAGFVVLDDAASVPRVAQAVARFLYVESCNQCSACKVGLRKASTALDALFDPHAANENELARAVDGARHAPQANRCYLPVQGSILIPSLLRRFAAEMDAQVAAPSSGPGPWLIPKMVDLDEAAGRFVYDESSPRKQPNWTYVDAVAPAVAPAPAAVAPQAPTPEGRPASPGGGKAAAKPGVGLPAETVHLAPDVRERLGRVVASDRELDAVVNEALRAWLGEQGA